MNKPVVGCCVVVLVVVGTFGVVVGFSKQPISSTLSFTGLTISELIMTSISTLETSVGVLRLYSTISVAPVRGTVFC